MCICARVCHAHVWICFLLIYLCTNVCGCVPICIYIFMYIQIYIYIYIYIHPRLEHLRLGRFHAMDTVGAHFEPSNCKDTTGRPHLFVVTSPAEGGRSPFFISAQYLLRCRKTLVAPCYIRQPSVPQRKLSCPSAQPLVVLPPLPLPRL